MELMITLAIGAILLGLAAPDLSRLVERSSVDARVGPLLEDLKAGRNAAVTKQASVGVCASTNGRNCCVFGCNNTWDQGWLVFTDCNNNGRRDTSGDICVNSIDTNAGEPILTARSFETNPKVTISAQDALGGTLIFTPNGMVDADSSLTGFLVDGDNNNFQISINAAGRINKTQTEGDY